MDTIADLVSDSLTQPPSPGKGPSFRISLATYPCLVVVGFRKSAARQLLIDKAKKKSSAETIISYLLTIVALEIEARGDRCFIAFSAFLGGIICLQVPS